MAANMRILPQGDGLDTLKELLTFVQNPKQFAEAQEVYRRQIQLTEDEQAKMNDARSFMENYEQKRQDIEEKSKALEEAQTKYQEEFAKFTADSEFELNRLQEMSDGLTLQAQEQGKVTKFQMSETTRLAALELSAQRTLADGQVKIDADRKFNDSKAADNVAEAARLKEESALLRTRIEKVKLREQAADL